MINSQVFTTATPAVRPSGIKFQYTGVIDGDQQGGGGGGNC